eukprot:4517678-Amphidinium_carterae.1
MRNSCEEYLNSLEQQLQDLNLAHVFLTSGVKQFVAILWAEGGCSLCLLWITLVPSMICLPEVQGALASKLVRKSQGTRREKDNTKYQVLNPQSLSQQCARSLRERGFGEQRRQHHTLAHHKRGGRARHITFSHGIYHCVIAKEKQHTGCFTCIVLFEYVGGVALATQKGGAHCFS